jgi:hypothetical protein
MPSKTSNAQPSARAEEPAASGQAPSGREILLCEKTFAGFCKSLPDTDVDERVLLCLIEADLRLLRIASARARRDNGATAREAGALARTAGILGFLQAAGLARQLEAACLSGDQAMTYGLIGHLSEVFQTSGASLDAMLRRRIIAKPGC